MVIVTQKEFWFVGFFLLYKMRIICSENKGWLIAIKYYYCYYLLAEENSDVLQTRRCRETNKHQLNKALGLQLLPPEEWTGRSSGFLTIGFQGYFSIVDYKSMCYPDTENFILGFVNVLLSFVTVEYVVGLGLFVTFPS